jgi:PAS domain S-box-containing protein
MRLSLPQFRNRLDRPIPLKSYLIRLMIGVVAPLLLFAILMMVLFARQEQSYRRRGLESAARSLTLSVDQEINASITKLEAFATSEALDTGAVKVFEAAAERFVKTQDRWRSVTLFSPRGAPLISATENGAGRAGITREILTEVLQTRAPVVSYILESGPGRASVEIHVPVVRERTIIYVLSAAIEPWVYTEILARQKIPPEWVATLYDANRVTIARSRDAKKLIALPVGPPLTQTNVLSGEQFLRGENARGDSVYAAVSRSQLTGWFLALTVPRAELESLLYGSLALVGGGGLLLLMSGLGVGLLFARRATDSIMKLSAAAHDLGRGASVTFPRSSPIAELDALAGEMARAGHLLREREDERDRVELELRQQEENLRRQADLLNLANEAIFATQLDSRILYWNRGAEQLYGYTPGEALGALSRELLAPEFPDGFSRFEAELMRAGEWTGELRQKAKHGRHIDVESRFKLIQDRAGNHLILECSRDITQRKRAARRLALEHQVTIALAESETHEAAWERLLEALGVRLDWEAAAFWLVNPERRVLECVRSWRAGADGAETCADREPLARGMGLPGRVWQSEASLWIPDLKTEAHTLQTSHPELGELRAAFCFPIRMRGAVLGVVELLSSTVRAIDAEMMQTVDAVGGEIGQFIERIRAEAALRASEEHLRSQAQQLEQQLLASGRLVAVGELTASMAHEFNNPLGIILGFAQGLLESMDPGDPDYAQIRIIADEAKRCERLVQELLEFGRPKDADFIQVHIEEIIQRTMNLVQPHAAKNGVDTALESDDKLPSLWADPQQLQQVLLNLSLNAVDAMPKGGRLTVKAARLNNEVMIAVEDTGIGIDADLLPRIFQPFVTSKKRRGLGLGLPICDRIVKAHGGRIRVRSRAGEGTIFLVYLPLLPPAAAKKQQAAGI